MLGIAAVLEALQYGDIVGVLGLASARSFDCISSFYDINYFLRTSFVCRRRIPWYEGIRRSPYTGDGVKLEVSVL